MSSYRYPNEQFILALTLLLVSAVIVLTAVATLCGSLLFVVIMLIISFVMNRGHHNELIQSAHISIVHRAGRDSKCIYLRPG
jgi:uncharacterized membrane protein YfhO